MDAVRFVDKPAGITSHDVVARVRRELPRGTKVGHAGTLDPFATGLLLILIGRATRAQRFLMSQRKTYVAQARFGWTSTTGDPEGEIVRTGVLPPEPLELPTGTIRQRPPAFSAVKVDGERAYAKARRGEAVEIAEREVHVHRFERLGDDEFLIECSSGTYVRTLITSLGDAYCTALRRTAIGPFTIAEAGDEVTLGQALARVMPTVRLDDEGRRRASHGMLVRGVVKPGTEHVLLLDGDGPVAIAEPRDAGELKPVVGFRG